VRQRKDETLRSYMQRFCQIAHTIRSSVILHFCSGVQDPYMRAKINTQSRYSRYDPIKTTTELYTMANKCAHAEEGRLALELI
jgi:hypothetical protein